MTATQLHFEGIKPRYFPWAARVDLMLRRAADGAAVTVDVLTAEDRRKHVVRARWAVMLALRDAGWALPRIGVSIGGRDHTTVLHGLREGEKLRLADRDFDELCIWVAG